MLFALDSLLVSLSAKTVRSATQVSLFLVLPLILFRAVESDRRSHRIISCAASARARSSRCAHGRASTKFRRNFRRFLLELLPVVAGGFAIEGFHSVKQRRRLNVMIECAAEGGPDLYSRFVFGVANTPTRGAPDKGGKPGSVPGPAMTIYLELPIPAVGLKRPTEYHLSRAHVQAPCAERYSVWSCTGWGFALPSPSPGMLVSSCLLAISPRHHNCLCRIFSACTLLPSRFRAWTLSSIPRTCGARIFLPRRNARAVIRRPAPNITACGVIFTRCQCFPFSEFSQVSPSFAFAAGRSGHSLAVPLVNAISAGYPPRLSA